MSVPDHAASAANGIASLPPTDSSLSPSKEEKEELAFGQVWQNAGQPVSPTNISSSQPVRPSLAERRKSSVQFHTEPAEETIRRESTCPPIPRPSTSSANIHRNPSPPPEIPYSRGISFDTFATPDAPAEAFSIQYKHNDFQYSPRTRTFICGTDAKDYSEYALEWTLDELVDDGDEIVCLRVVSEDSTERREYRREADRLLASVIAKNAIERKAISLKMELAVGKVTDVIQSMIQLYEPVAIIVGTRGRALTGMQGLVGGRDSVSKYCLQRSPVPTIVVRPSSKRTKKKLKRQAEQGRSVYTNILSKAQTLGGRHALDRGGPGTDGFELKGGEEEANAVEKAVGPPQRRGILRNKHVYGGPLARVTSTSETEDDDPNTRFALPIGYLSTESAPKADLAMKSPIIQALAEWDDSPRGGSRTASPAGKREENEAVLTDTDDDMVGMPTIVDERRPSTRSQTPWLNSILSRPEPKGGRRPESRERVGSRSRSREG